MIGIKPSNITYTTGSRFMRSHRTVNLNSKDSLNDPKIHKAILAGIIEVESSESCSGTRQPNIVGIGKKSSDTGALAGINAKGSVDLSSKHPSFGTFTSMLKQLKFEVGTDLSRVFDDIIEKWESYQGSEFKTLGEMVVAIMHVIGHYDTPEASQAAYDNAFSKASQAAFEHAFPSPTPVDRDSEEGGSSTDVPSSSLKLAAASPRPPIKMMGSSTPNSAAASPRSQVKMVVSPLTHDWYKANFEAFQAIVDECADPFELLSYIRSFQKDRIRLEPVLASLLELSGSTPTDEDVARVIDLKKDKKCYTKEIEYLTLKIGRNPATYHPSDLEEIDRTVLRELVGKSPRFEVVYRGDSMSNSAQLFQLDRDAETLRQLLAFVNSQRPEDDRIADIQGLLTPAGQTEAVGAQERLSALVVRAEGFPSLAQIGAGLIAEVNAWTLQRNTTDNWNAITALAGFYNANLREVGQDEVRHLVHRTGTGEDGDPFKHQIILENLTVIQDALNAKIAALVAAQPEGGVANVRDTDLACFLDTLEPVLAQLAHPAEDGRPKFDFSAIIGQRVIREATLAQAPIAQFRINPGVLPVTIPQTSLRAYQSIYEKLNPGHAFNPGPEMYSIREVSSLDELATNNKLLKAAYQQINGINETLRMPQNFFVTDEVIADHLSGSAKVGHSGAGGTAESKGEEGDAPGSDVDEYIQKQVQYLMGKIKDLQVKETYSRRSIDAVKLREKEKAEAKRLEAERAAEAKAKAKRLEAERAAKAEAKAKAKSERSRVPAASLDRPVGDGTVVAGIDAVDFSNPESILAFLYANGGSMEDVETELGRQVSQGLSTPVQQIKLNGGNIYIQLKTEVVTEGAFDVLPKTDEAIKALTGDYPICQHDRGSYYVVTKATAKKTGSLINLIVPKTDSDKSGARNDDL